MNAFHRSLTSKMLCGSYAPSPLTNYASIATQGIPRGSVTYDSPKDRSYVIMSPRKLSEKPPHEPYAGTKISRRV
ncbi:hypothetical protein KIN20_028188 [Parelaphostrongylus tenuis]|uniref:Uncharacterized protein n=1 Tax=Parelaphostrongylus tenuis TaxID=148309 RepID=A0AAD5R0Q3_PARTN|nr:hypothetical protein KIN20_028188 [Parelaphostrongylus tenuis]